MPALVSFGHVNFAVDTYTGFSVFVECLKVSYLYSGRCCRQRDVWLACTVLQLISACIF